MNQNRIYTKEEILLRLIKKQSHGRELSKELAIPLSSVQRYLKSLEEQNVVDFAITGRNRVYSLKGNLVARRYIFGAEGYKLIKLVDKYPYLEPLLRSIIDSAKSNLIMLFGSYAKFAAKPDSDIDVYLETRDENLKRQLEQINTRLSVKIGKFNTTSLLIKEIVKNHVILKGIEHYYERLGFFKDA